MIIYRVMSWIEPIDIKVIWSMSWIESLYSKTFVLWVESNHFLKVRLNRFQKIDSFICLMEICWLSSKMYLPSVLSFTSTLTSAKKYRNLSNTKDHWTCFRMLVVWCLNLRCLWAELERRNSEAHFTRNRGFWSAPKRNMIKLALCWLSCRYGFKIFVTCSWADHCGRDLVQILQSLVQQTDSDPGNMNGKIRKIWTNKFDTWNKRKCWFMKLT